MNLLSQSSNDATSSNSCSRNCPVESQIFDCHKQKMSWFRSCFKAATATFTQYKLTFPSAYFNLVVFTQPSRVQSGSCLLSCLPCYQQSEPVPPQIKPCSSLPSATDGEAGLQRHRVCLMCVSELLEAGKWASVALLISQIFTESQITLSYRCTAKIFILWSLRLLFSVKLAICYLKQLM